MAAPNPTDHFPTLREIARRAGVSHTTVSLALRNDPTIPPRTRTRLRRLSDAMGYRPNVLVSALMTQVRLRSPPRTPEVIGFLTGGPSAEDWKNHSASVGFFEGAQRRARELGMRLETFWLGLDGARSPEICRVLRTRSIRGNLITPFPIPIYPEEFDWSHLVCVALGYAFRAQPLHRATHHHFRGSFVAMENLLRLGYRRVGLMLDQTENSRVGYAWLGGYLSARHMLGAEPLEPLVAETWEPESVRRWVASEKPDAVLGFGPQQLRALQSAGFAVPRDVAYAALDVQQTNLAAVPQVAGIDQNLPLIGATAIDILAGQLYHNEHGLPQRPVLSMIEGFWVNGKTAPARGAAARANVLAIPARRGASKHAPTVRRK